MSQFGFLDELELTSIKWQRDHSRLIGLSLSLTKWINRMFFNGKIGGFGQAASDSVIRVDLDVEEVENFLVRNPADVDSGSDLIAVEGNFNSDFAWLIWTNCKKNYEHFFVALLSHDHGNWLIPFWMYIGGRVGIAFCWSKIDPHRSFVESLSDLSFVKWNSVFALE